MLEKICFFPALELLGKFTLPFGSHARFPKQDIMVVWYRFMGGLRTYFLLYLHLFVELTRTTVRVGHHHVNPNPHPSCQPVLLVSTWLSADSPHPIDLTVL